MALEPSKGHGIEKGRALNEAEVDFWVRRPGNPEVLTSIP
jgi:hypothetical protein